MNKIYGLLRIRNEEEILEDTLNHLSEFCSAVFVYDDCSEDNSPEICKNHPIVKSLILGKNWDINRERAEYQNRQAILNEAKKFADEDDWFVYLDADERIEFDWGNLCRYGKEVIAVRMRLFDFYITPEDINENYYQRKYIGPEYREIIMAFRNLPSLKYEAPDQREVTLGKDGIIINAGFVKHYGKAISIEAWEKKCDYYSNYFPKYSDKWLKRKGKAIHTKSDFGFELITWAEKESKGFLLTPEIEKSNELEKFPKLNILLATHHLLDFTGSEIFTITIAEKLKSKGNNVIIYSPYNDKTARQLQNLGFLVTDNLELINNFKFDIAHVHHNIIAAEVRYYFPQLPIVYLSHGVIPFLEQPPTLDLNISRYLAVSEETKINLINKGVEENQIIIFRNMVDHQKFNPKKKINKSPEKILVISGRIDSQKEQLLRKICSDLKIDLQFIGGRFGEVSQEELITLIENSDIIFSLGRGAIEAMMMERAVIVYDYLGGDGMITTENFAEIMKCNFSGRRYSFQYTEEELLREIKKYNPDDVKKLRMEIIKHFDANKLINDLINIYIESISSFNDRTNQTERKLISYFVESIRETRNYSIETMKRKEKEKFLFDTMNYSNNKSEQDFDQNEMLLKAEELIEEGNFTDARKYLDRLLVSNPLNSNALNDLACIEIISGNYSQAIEYIQNTLAINPNDEVAINNLNYLIENDLFDNNLIKNSLLKIFKVPLQLNKISGYESFVEYELKKRNEYDSRNEFELKLIPADKDKFQYNAFCVVCDDLVPLHVDFWNAYQINGRKIPNWRERLVCPSCKLNNRMRLSFHIIKELVPDFSNSTVYITEQTTPLFQILKKLNPSIIGSEFLGSTFSPGSFNNIGIRNEDFTNLSFQNEQFDLIISLEVLGHIPDYVSALREAYRVLKKNGKFLFTVPFNKNSRTNLVRAKLNSDGSITHFLPAEYHGDPMNLTQGCLCYYHFGWELLDELKSVGFQDAYALLTYSKEYGYLGGEQIFFIAEKGD